MTAAAAPTAPRWKGVSSSVRGASHVRTGLVNQDAVEVVVHDVGYALTSAAVSDGHGGARYVRSDRGSALAVAIACRLAADVGVAVGRGASTAAVRSALDGYVAQVVSDWRAAATQDLADRPFDDDELQASGGTLHDGDPLIAYGCTLLVALLSPEWVAFVQIGDGDVVLVASDGSTSAPVPGDDRLVGGETTSLCLPTAVADTRFAVTDDLPEIVLLATDGYGNSFESPDWMSETGMGFAQVLHESGWDKVVERLPSWLAESAEAGGDDVTVALLVRRGALAPGAAAPPPSPAPTRRGGLAAVVVTALAALLVGGLIGWVLAGSDEAPDEVPAISSSVVTSSSVPDSTSTSTTVIQAGGSSTTERLTRAVILVPEPASDAVQVIEFSPEIPSAPDARVTATLSSTQVSPVTATFFDDAYWSIDSEGLLLRQASPNGRERPVDIGGESGGGLAVAGDLLWIVSADGARMLPLTATGSPPPGAGWSPVGQDEGSEWLN